MKILLYNSKDIYIVKKDNSYKLVDSSNNKPYGVKYSDDGLRVIFRYLGAMRDLDLEWLFHLSLHNPKFPKNYEQEVFKLKYYNICYSKIKNLYKLLPIFIKPVYYTELPKTIKNEFRLIARNPSYCISKDGLIYKCSNSRLSIIDNQIGTDNYPRVSIGGKSVFVHRLLAETWIKNDDYYNKIIVDHIDADKKNYSLNNLRWGSLSDNIKFAMEQNVKLDNMPIITRNIDTGEEKEHLSITLACEYMGRSRINTHQQPLEPNKIWYGSNGRFELKFKDDKRDWYYLNKKENERNNISQTLITFKNGDTVKEYKSCLEASIDLLGYNTTKGFEHLITCVKLKYPNGEISYKTGRPIQAKRLSDGLILEAPSTIKLIEKIGEDGFKKSTVNKYVLLRKALNGWLFRIKPDDPNTPWYCVGSSDEVKNKPKKIVITRIIDGYHYVFDSLRKAAGFLGIDKATLKKHYLDKPGALYKNAFRIEYAPLEE